MVWVVHGYQYASAAMPIDYKILDVGSGQDPHPGANVILDKFIESDEHRMGQSEFLVKPVLTYVDGGEYKRDLKVVCGDIIELPFPDKSFDFIIANNVLEHIEDIEQAFAEISRVGKNGFIDVPRLSSEWLFPQGKIHKWVFTVEQGELVAHSLKNFETPFGQIMHKVFSENEDVQDAWAKSRHYFHCVKLWSNEVKVKIGHPI